jgi:hypothetical protein
LGLVVWQELVAQEVFHMAEVLQATIILHDPLKIPIQAEL